MALGTKEHLKRQLNKHCNYKNENQQFFQVPVLLSHDSTWNCKQSTYFSQLLGKDIFLIGHEVYRWGMKIFVLAIEERGKKTPSDRRENSQFISCIFLRETLKKGVSVDLNPQKIYQKIPQTILNLRFLWVSKCAPRKFINLLKILQDMKSVS